MKRVAGWGMAVWLLAAGTVWADSLYKADEYSAWVAGETAWLPTKGAAN